MIVWIVAVSIAGYIGWRAGAWWATDCAARMLVGMVKAGELRREALDAPAERYIPDQDAGRAA